MRGWDEIPQPTHPFKLNVIDPKADYYSTLEEENIDDYDTPHQRLKAFTDHEFACRLEREIEET